MKLVRGFVLDVIDMGEGDKAYAVVGIEETIKNRNGFDVRILVEFNIRGRQLESGLHNAYRALKGVEVFAPFSDEIDTFYKDRPRIRYNLLGVPVRLQDVQPVQRPAMNPTSVPPSAGSPGSVPASSSTAKVG